MKTKLRPLPLTLALLVSATTQPFAQGTAFTYQGRLNNGTNPVTGSYDLVFTLYNTNTTGAIIAGPVGSIATGVTNGLFMATIDFGPGVFTGSSNWLEIAVRTNGGGSYIPLTPRQQVTPTPYAIYSANAGSAATATTATTAGSASSVAAANVSGTLVLGQLPAGVLTNNETGVNLTGAFTGNGTGLTNVNAANLSGTLPLAQLPGVVVTNNATSVNLAGSFTGSGTGLTNVNAAALNGLNAASFWKTNGNAGANPTNGAFLGTADNLPLEFHVNGARALRLESGGASASLGNGTPTGAPNVVGGSPVNYVASGVVGAVIGGGGATNYGGSSYTNSVSADVSFLGGGVGNSIQLYAAYSVLGGGYKNSIQTYAYYSFLGGGYENFIQPSAAYSVLGGGFANYIQTSASDSFLGGGGGNSIQAGANDSVLIGGGGNSIQTSAAYSVLGGGNGNTIQTGATNSVLVGGQGNSIQTNAYESVLGGGENNSIQTDAKFSVLGGGGANSIQTNVQFSVLGGGFFNSIQPSADDSFLGGGSGNSIQTNAYASFLGGGSGNSIQPSADDSVLSGGSGNSIQTNAYASVLGGGSSNSIQPWANDSFLGGGSGNSIQAASYSFLGGGSANSIQFIAGGSVLGGGAYNSIQPNASYAFLGGGFTNSIQPSATCTFLGGGYGNSITGPYAVIAGGSTNTAVGSYSTVPGGSLNVAQGTFSFAAGQQAHANNQGAFVWADSQNATYASWASDQFCIRAQGGVQLDPTTSLFFGSNTRQMVNLYGTAYGIGVQAGTLFFRSDGSFANSGDFSWFRGGTFNNGQNQPGSGGAEMMRLDHLGNLNVSNNVVAHSLILASDRNLKSNFIAVDAQAVLAKVSALPITAWNFKSEAGVRHLGPMAQDFYAAFGMGADDKHIAVVDEGGVALAAIQGLNQKLNEKDAEIQDLKQQNDSLSERLNELEAAVKVLAEKK